MMACAQHHGHPMKRITFYSCGELELYWLGRTPSMIVGRSFKPHNGMQSRRGVKAPEGEEECYLEEM